MQYMKARLITRWKEVHDDGSIVEIVIWELPRPLAPSRHRYKYRLAYIVDGVPASPDTTTNGARAITGTLPGAKRFTSLSALTNC